MSGKLHTWIKGYMNSYTCKWYIKKHLYPCAHTRCSHVNMHQCMHAHIRMNCAYSKFRKLMTVLLIIFAFTVSDVPHKHIFHMMFVILFMLFNDGPGKHIILPDAIGCHNIFSTPVQINILVARGLRVKIFTRRTKAPNFFVVRVCHSDQF